LQIRIARLGGQSPLVIENADWLTEAFFALDPSGKPGGFDDKAIESSPTRIEAKDVDAINGTMRARSPQKAWASPRSRTALASEYLPTLGACRALGRGLEQPCRASA
jgi:hypothetical protein